MCDSRFKQKIRTRLAFGITQIILKVYNSLKGKLACFANNSGSLHIHDFWKKYHEVHVSLRCTSNTKSLKEITFSLEITFVWTNGLYRYMTYTLTEGRNFKTFMKENYAIALDSCWTWNVDSAYGVCIH